MFKEFLYGVCYFPEHWDPKRHPSDIERIARAGFQYVRMGEGAWSYWEPSEGNYQFELFDRVIDLCRKHDVKVIMGTPTYCGPAWIAHQYPEVLRWNFNRVPMAHGSRRNYNYTSPKYLELSDKVCTALAKHYAKEKQIIAWQLDNEFNCHMDVSYAPSDTLAWRDWLKDKYKTLDNLNRCWGTAFWSLTYSAWEQIDLPHPSATYLNPSVLLDESRFISDCVIRFADRQAEILRKANPRWLITHNGIFNNVKARDLAKSIDFFSHDHYPLFFPHWTNFSASLLQSRSLTFPFAIMEQQAGPGGQSEYLHRTPRKGEMRLWTWQSIAHGAKVFSYFRWRTCPYGAEQHWHGLLDQDDRDNRRLAEANQVGKEIKSLPNDFYDAPVTRSVGVLRDYDNEVNDRRINTYNKNGPWEQFRWTTELQKRHVQTDVLWPDSDWAGYSMIISPHLKIVDAALVKRMKQFVSNGGTLVLGAQSGLMDLNNHIVEMPLPGLLRDLAGVEVEDWTMLPDPETRVAKFDTGETISMFTFVERLKPLKAKSIAQWNSSDTLLDSAPAITLNKVGKGQVIYIGGYLPHDAIAQLVDQFIREKRVNSVAIASTDIEAVERRGKKTYLVLLNHSAHESQVGDVTGTEILSHLPIEKGTITLPAYGVAIIAR